MRKLVLTSTILAVLTATALSQPLPSAGSVKEKSGDSLENIELRLSSAAKGIVAIRDGRSRCDTDQCRLDFDEAAETQLQLLAVEIEYRLARLHDDAGMLDLLSARYQAVRGKAWELQGRVLKYSGPVPTCSRSCAQE